MSKPETCVWTLSDPDYAMWETDCGHAFEFTDGGPKDNECTFCCYCGKPLEEERVADAADEEDETE